MKLMLRMKVERPQVVVTYEEVELSAQELEKLLINTSFYDDGSSIRAADLMEYFNNTGEFRNYIELAARHDDVGYFMNDLAQSVAYGDGVPRVLEREVKEYGDDVLSAI